ncbi:cadherin repeat domain-containing protein, partial [Gammaproteobacteria bacterium]|nr:cadherin repeat domain-containing protein [Gammaproteobacteria bacterium]
SKINFAPNLNWFGSEELSYMITAGSESRSGKVSLVYLPVNDPPVFNAISRTIEVTVEPNSNGTGNVYVIDEIQKNSLTLEPGSTYTFNHPPAHPLRFSTTSDGTHGSGAAYETDVDTSNDGITIIKVSEDTPTLYYYCSIHRDMGSNTSIPSSSIASFIVLENSVSDISTIAATDVDNEILTYSLTGDDKDLFTVSTSGILKFRSSPNYEDPLDINKDSNYKLSLNVSDGEIIISKEIQVPIKDVNIAADQIGSTIKGIVNVNAQTCWRCLSNGIDIDADGDTFIVGIYGNRDRAGSGRGYQRINNSWSEMSSKSNNFNGAAEGNGFGFLMQISDDGLTLISKGQQQSIGYIFPLEYFDEDDGAGPQWKRKGNYVDYGSIYRSIPGQGISDIAVSGDAKVMGWIYAGVPIIHGEGNADYTFGGVREELPTRFSKQIAINYDGTYVAVSNNANNSYSKVSVYKWDESSYTQIGDSLLKCSGDTSDSNVFGERSLEISNDGKTIAVSDHYADDPNTTETRTGAICIFTYTDSTWTQKGKTIWGDNERDEFGNSMSLSGDGKRIAIGATESGVEVCSISVCADNGLVRVFDWSNLDSEWKQTGFDIVGGDATTTAEAKRMGNVALSSDGKTVVIQGRGEAYSSGSSKDGGVIQVFNLPIN